jgi:uncharacterized protein YggU (UPF0235/DUF167 family)
MPDVRVRIKPGSRAGEHIESLADGSLIVQLRARPIEGAANDALLALLAAHWRVPKSRLAIVRGGTSRQKVVRRP